MADDLRAVIMRVRRSTSNGDVLTICDELQRRLSAPAEAFLRSDPGTFAVSPARVAAEGRTMGDGLSRAVGRDRAAYMRAYRALKKKRAAG